MTLFLIVIGAASRLIPHLPNFTPITALALFSAARLRKRDAFLIPLGSMFLSDLILSHGYYGPTQFYVYGSFVLIGFLGLCLRRRHSYFLISTSSFAASFLFFVLTNFGVWASPTSWYPRTIYGLVECYLAAIPFFRNTLMGDLFYTLVFFGAFEILTGKIKNKALRSDF